MAESSLQTNIILFLPERAQPPVTYTKNEIGTNEQPLMQVPTEFNKLPENSTHLHQQSNTSKTDLKLSQSPNRHRRTKTIQQEAAHKNTTLKPISKQSYNITQVNVEQDSIKEPGFANQKLFVN